MSDGEYVSERLFRLGAQGIYFAETGALLLVSAPLSDVSALDRTLVLPNNVSYTASQLWDLQIDPTKFQKNPFSDSDSETSLPGDTDSILGVREDNPTKSIDTCSYILIAQLETKEESRNKASLRTWRTGRPHPYDTSEDVMSLETSLDEDRLVYRMHGSLVSPGCGIKFDLKNDTRSSDYDSIVSNGKMYAIVTVFQALALAYFTISHVESRASHAGMMKMSPLGLLLQVCSDAAVSIFHLLTAFSYPPISLPIYFVFFVYSAVYGTFQMRYLLDMCKLAWNAGTLGSVLSRIYIYLYAYLGLVILFALVFEPLIWIPLLVAHSCWIFQIGHNVAYRTRNAYSWRYLIGTTLCRSWVPAYLYMWPSQRLIALPFRSSMILAFFIMDAILVSILIAQDKWGPRFFIPAWLGPAIYNYRRDIPVALFAQSAHAPAQSPTGLPHAPNAQQIPQRLSFDAANQQRVTGPTCTICMSEVNPFAHEHMIAPCNHVFHEECLLRWMEQKMECPVCRGRLPVPPELDHDEHDEVPAAAAPRNGADLV